MQYVQCAYTYMWFAAFRDINNKIVAVKATLFPPQVVTLCHRRCMFTACKRPSPVDLLGWSVDAVFDAQSTEHIDERSGYRIHRGKDWRPSCRTPVWCWRCRTRPATEDRRSAHSPPRSHGTACSTRRRPAASLRGSSRLAPPRRAWRASSPASWPAFASSQMSSLSRFHGSCRWTLRPRSDGRWVRRSSAEGVTDDRASVGTPVRPVTVNKG